MYRVVGDPGVTAASAASAASSILVEVEAKVLGEAVDTKARIEARAMRKGNMTVRGAGALSQLERADNHWTN